MEGNKLSGTMLQEACMKKAYECCFLQINRKMEDQIEEASDDIDEKRNLNNLSCCLNRITKIK